MTVRVRFAPSPTGYLHIGGARTALFNWLLARKLRGTFILRIEDTDQDRNVAVALGPILHSLRWLGLEWGEGPQFSEKDSILTVPKLDDFYQSVRFHKGLYQRHADELIAKGFAYPCYCTPEDVEKMREKALAEKRNPQYDGTCRNLTPDQRKTREAEGRPKCVRFKSPSEGKTEYQDLIKDLISVENTQLEDFVLQRSSGFPTYNFACVVDDHDMKISHVLRGDDHVSNTPRQLLIYKAFGWEPPQFGHMSMILAADGTRLSKRRHAVAVGNYEKSGYLPQAMVNYLALLGWSTEDSQQLFKLDELIQKFSVDRCVKSPAVFDPEKLAWMNGEYIRAMSAKDLTDRARWFIVQRGLVAESDFDKRRSEIEAVVALEQEKVKTLEEIPGRIDIFFKDVEFNPEAVEKVLKKPDVQPILEESIKMFEALEPFTAASTEEACKGLAAKRGIKNGAVFHPVRVSVSGRTQGPSLFHMLELLGKQRSVERIKNVLEKFF